VDKTQKRRDTGGACNQDSRGVRYSVFSFNELADWCNEDLWYGSQARDLSYEDALQELRREAISQFNDLLEQAEIAAAEVDNAMSDAKREKFIEAWFVENEHLSDDSDFVEDYVQRNAENIQIDEPIIEGTLDGIDYHVSWLGGAPIVYFCGGLKGFGSKLCSPCVPGAVCSSGEFILPGEEGDTSGMYECYVPPRSWFRQE